MVKRADACELLTTESDSQGLIDISCSVSGLFDIFSNGEFIFKKNDHFLLCGEASHRVLIYIIFYGEVYEGISNGLFFTGFPHVSHL